MKISDTYHSAFRDETFGLGELEAFSSGSSEVFRHSVCDGVREEFRRCDCIYVEPAWQCGYRVFQERAGSKSPDFAAYLHSIRRVVEELKKPTFLVGGKHMRGRLAPHTAGEVELNGFSALLMVWNAELPAAKTVADVQRILASRYACVLDFCCGYGDHLRQFKSFVACDINKKCVYCVATNYMGYKDAATDPIR